ncbi:hypothetical protein Tco_1056065 [Tanacetum coccineum]|uniref:Uncharacterized protein n=1 Tax=Tanacetum coccineum TaxID=301880 RepID=A0ABQ5H1G4_9ASTR
MPTSAPAATSSSLKPYWEDCESALQRLGGENTEISKEAAISLFTKTIDSKFNFALDINVVYAQYRQCKDLSTLKDVRLLYATHLCIPHAIVAAHQIVAD